VARALHEDSKGILLSLPVSRSDGPHEEKTKAAFGRRGVGGKSFPENVKHRPARAETKLGKTVSPVCSGFTAERQTLAHSG